MEAHVRSLRRAFPGEHPGWILTEAPIWIHAAGVRVATRQIFLVQEVEQLAPIGVIGSRDFRNFLVAKALTVIVARDFPATDSVGKRFCAHAFLACRPLTQ